MTDNKAAAKNIDSERIDVDHEYALCAWARHFNASQRQVREAVQAVGDRAGRVREHLMRQGGSDRPSAR